MIPEVDRHDWGLVIFMDNQRQTIGQYVFLVRNVDFEIVKAFSRSQRLNRKPGEEQSEDENDCFGVDHKKFSGCRTRDDCRNVLKGARTFLSACACLAQKRRRGAPSRTRMPALPLESALLPNQPIPNRLAFLVV